MAIWYPPPPPFIGGRQPHDPRKFLPPVPDTPAPTRDRKNLAVIMLWPREDWPAQTGSQFAKFITPDNPPLRHLVQRLTAILQSWPAESWPAQRGAVIYPLIPPDAPPRRHLAQRLTAILSWPRESWPAQRSQFATPPSVDPPPVATRATQNLGAILSWPAESWPAQRGAIIWPLVPPDVPQPTRDRQNLRAIQIWPREDWPAQRSGIIAPIIPPRVDRPPTQRYIQTLNAILSWPREDWRAQRSGITIQSGGASPVTLPIQAFPGLMFFNSTDGGAIAGYFSQIRSVVNNILGGKLNATVNFSLSPLTTQTTLTDPRIGGASYVGLEPLTINAAAEIANGTIYPIAQGKQFITFAHANSFTTDRSFVAVIIG